MRPVEQLLLVGGLARGAYGRWRFQRILPVLITLTLLAVITAALMSALAIGGMYALYVFLLDQGFTTPLAFLETGLIAVAFILALLVAIRRRLRQLRFSMRAPLGEAVDAFLDGLLNE